MKLDRILIFITTCFAASAFAQAAKWQEPQVVSQGRELPRSPIISYPSTNEALLQSRKKSLYLQPLADEWSSSRDANSTTYSRGYKLPFEWVDRQLFLHIGAVSSAYEVEINGRTCAYNQSGMSAAEYNITSLSQEGNNTVKIIVYTSAISSKIENREGLSATGRGSKTAHIEGEVYITAQPSVRVRDYIAQARMEGCEGRIELGVVLKSHLLNPKDIRMYYQLFSPVGELITEGRRDIHIDMRKEDTVRFYVAVPEALPWSHEAPNLYTMVIRTQNEGRFTEYVSLKIGLRTVETGGAKLLINSREIPLTVAQYAAPDSTELMQSELTELKARGINTIKVNATPQPREFYETCDILGLYVCNQADINTHLSSQSLTTGGTPSNDPTWRDAYVDRAMTMYHTSKNHPSVVMFSLGENSANGYNLYESYIRMKEIESSRPIIYTDAKGEWNSDALSNNTPPDDLSRWSIGLDGKPRLVFGVTQNHVIQAPSQMITISVTDSQQQIFNINNNYLLTPLRNAEVEYTVRVGRRIVSQGVMPIDVAAGSSSEITIPRGKAKTGDKTSVALSVMAIPQPFNYIPTPNEGETKQNFLERIQQNLNLNLNPTPKTVKTILAEASF